VSGAIGSRSSTVIPAQRPATHPECRSPLGKRNSGWAWVGLPLLVRKRACHAPRVTLVEGAKGWCCAALARREVPAERPAPVWGDQTYHHPVHDQPVAAIGEQEHTAGYLAEFEFIREGMRQDQRERHGFLGFTLATNGLVLGLVIREEPPYAATEVCVLLCVTMVVTLIAERMTRRASLGVASAGAYIRLFIEPHVSGLAYQGRNPDYIKIIRNAGSASRAFGLAYFAVTLVGVLAWLALPVEGPREGWQSAVLAVVAGLSFIQVAQLVFPRFRGIARVERGWDNVYRAEMDPIPD
jgi:hypothetical protein